MDSETNNTTVWITLLGLGNGTITSMLVLSFVLAFCFWKYRDREDYYLNMEFGRCCFFACRFKRYIPYLIIFSLFGTLLPSLLFNVVIIVLCQLMLVNSTCQALSGIYFSLAVVLLFLYVVCLIGCSRHTCTCHNWRYIRNSRSHHHGQADDPDLAKTDHEFYDPEDHLISDNQGIPLLTRGPQTYEGRYSGEENQPVIDNKLLYDILPEYSSEPRQPEPHQQEPHQPEPRQPEPRQPEPHQPKSHQPEPHQPEPHQHELRQSGPHLPHQKIGSPSTEFVCSLLGDDIPKHNIAQTCFVLGDIHTLHITHQGGTFPLHPFGPCGGGQQVECCATLEAPPGVVGSGDTVSVHYAIILDGPFKFPEKWERTSVVLYIDCPDSRFLIEPLTVNLHHWAVSSGTSRMCFMKSSHLLQKGQTMFTFKCHANAIPSQPNVASVYLKDHFCLVCVAAESDVMVTSRYYGILLSDPLEDRVEKFWLCITYALPSWVQAVTEYYRKREGSEGRSYIPEYKEIPISYGNKVKVDMENESGSGWDLTIADKEVRLRDVDSLSRYTSCTEKEKAVRFGSYPPSVMFQVTYDNVPSPETHKPITKLARLLSESGDTISLFFRVQKEKAVITDVNMSSNRPVQGAWTELTHYNHSQVDIKLFGEPSKPLKVQHLMPYINDLADEVVSIAGWLGMHSELEVIKRTPGIINPREQLQELLKKWLEDTERPTAPHTWEYFIGMVQGVGKGHVAERIVQDVFTESRLPSDTVALEKYVISKMADNWYQFGIQLGLPEDTLKAIDDSKLKIKKSTRCLVMFQQWMEEIGPVENKMDKIEQAMKEVMKVTGNEKSRMTSMCGSEQEGEASSISNDAIPAWVEKMAGNWFNFGVALGFSEEDLQSIKDSNGDDVARCSAMMYRWLRTGDQREKTYEKLLRAEKEVTPAVVPNGMSPEPPPYSESERVAPEVPHFILKV